MDWKEELLKRLDALAAKLGTTSVYLWQVLVKQGYVQGITDLAGALIALTLTIVFLVLMNKGLKLSKQNDWENDSETTLFVTCLLASILVFGMFCGLGTNAAQELANPEYYALQHILESLK